MKEQFEQPSFEYVYIEGWFRACKSGGGTDIVKYAEEGTDCVAANEMEHPSSGCCGK